MTRLAFGGFELDPTTGELWKGEECVRIQEQPLKLLVCLLERPGQLVGREELQKRVWAGDIHVGFEDGLNAAACRLRQVLGDSAERPRFIETVPRKGYRFVEKVLPLPGNPPPPSGSFPMPVYRPSSGPYLQPIRAGWLQRHRNLWLAGVAAASLLGVGLWGALRPRPVSLAITPLLNLTGDPAVDYFASALARQVGQDLAAIPGLKVLPRDEAASQGLGADSPAGEADVTLTWTLDRDARGYRIPVSLAGPGGSSLGDQVFIASPEDLRDIHRPIADHIASRSLRKHAESPG